MTATVLHIITRMTKGGAQENTLANVAGVDPRRFRSILATGPSDGPEGSLLEEVRAVCADVRLVPSLQRELSPARDLRALGELRRLIREVRPQIVHTHMSKAGILGRIAARRERVPIVIHTPHGHVFHSYFSPMKTRLFIALERWCSRYADRLVMLTENELKEHLELRIAPPEKFTVIHSGVDFGKLWGQATGGFDTALRACSTTGDGLRRELGIPEDAAVVGSIGRLAPIKGHEHLIRAMAAFRCAPPPPNPRPPERAGESQSHSPGSGGKGKAWSHLPLAGGGKGEGAPGAPHLLLVGTGELEGSLRRLAGDLGLDGRVHFAGHRSDVGRCLEAMDVFVLPSLNEGMGRVLVEAMAMRVPCVASDVSGIRDLVKPGVNGLLVPPADAGALAEAIGVVLNDATAARRYADVGYATAVPHYSVENMVRKLEGLYDEVLQEKGLG